MKIYRKKRISVRPFISMSARLIGPPKSVHYSSFMIQRQQSKFTDFYICWPSSPLTETLQNTTVIILVLDTTLALIVFFRGGGGGGALNSTWRGGAHFLRISTACSGTKWHFNALIRNKIFKNNRDTFLYFPWINSNLFRNFRSIFIPVREFRQKNGMYIGLYGSAPHPRLFFQEWYTIMPI